MQVCVGGERHGQSSLSRGRMHRTQVAAHVDYQRSSVAEIDEVGRITQAVIDERNQVHVGHCENPSAAPIRAGQPTWKSEPAAASQTDATAKTNRRCGPCFGHGPDMPKNVIAARDHSTAGDINATPMIVTSRPTV